MTGGNGNWRQDVRRSSRTAAIKFEFSREERQKERESQRGKGTKTRAGLVRACHALPTTREAKPSRDRHRDRGRHSTLGVFSASCQPRQRIRRDGQTDRRTVRLASDCDCDSDISMSPCLHPHPFAFPFSCPMSRLVSRIPSTVSLVSAVSFAFNFYLPCYNRKQQQS